MHKVQLISIFLFLLGLMIISLVIGEKEQKVAISFIDGTDLIIERDNTTQHIQQTIKIYNSYYTATGVYIEYSKTIYYLW